MPRRRLPGAALQHVPHDDFLDGIGRYPAALERGADGDGTKLGRRKGGKASEIPADRRARGTNDDGLACKVGHDWETVDG